MIFNIEIFFNSFFLITLIIVSVIDFKKLYIPNFSTFSLLIVGIFYNWFFKNNLLYSILGAAIYSFPFSLIYGYLSDVLNKEVIGYGDVKLAMGIGACIGFSTFEKAYLFFMYSFLAGSIYAISLLIKTKKRDYQLPFGPFISISGCIIMFFY